MYRLSNNEFIPRLNCSYCHIEGEKTGNIYQPNYFTFPIGKVSVEKDLCNNITLRRCPQCSMLYKDNVIKVQSQAKIYEHSSQRYSYNPSNKYILRKIKTIKELTHMENSHLLDIGCHTGDFLKLARAEGLRTSGADYSDTAYAGHEAFISENFYKGLIEEIQLPDNCFDFITAWDVFEHFYDVKAALQKIYTAIKPGGYLLLETGNVSSLGARLMSPNYWWYVCGLTHLNFFDASSIRYILNDTGFTVKNTEKVYHKSIASLNTIDFLKRINKCFAFSLSSSIYKYITGLMGKSSGAAALPCKDHLFVIARK